MRSENLEKENRHRKRRDGIATEDSKELEYYSLLYFHQPFINGYFSQFIHVFQFIFFILFHCTFKITATNIFNFTIFFKKKA